MLLHKSGLLKDLKAKTEKWFEWKVYLNKG